MSRTKDGTMDLMRGAAVHLAANADLPNSGTKEGESEEKLLALLAAVRERLVRGKLAPV